MKKIYSIKLLFLMILFVSAYNYALSNNDISKKDGMDNIEGLTIFPNPVNNGKVYIHSKLNLNKDIEIYDVLGKKVMAQVLYNKELNIQNLKTGVYILKIKEGKMSVTRKLVVR